MSEERSAEEIILEAQEARREGQPAKILLVNADLSGAQLSGMDLVGADLEGADLTGAVLAGAFLKRANLKNAILVGASLDGADLTETDLRGADLAGARIDDAVLANARLDGACLQLVFGDPLSMNGATMDKITIERSEFTMRDIAMMIVRGAYVDEHDEAPISLRGAGRASAPPSSSEGLSDPLGLQLVSPEIPPMDFGLSDLGFDAQVPSGSAPISGGVDEILNFDKPLSSIPNIRKALASLPPSARGTGPISAPASSLIPPSRGQSIVPSFRAAEISTRISQVEQDEQMPMSQRMFQQLTALIDNARIEAAPVSLRPAIPAVQQMVAGSFVFPMPGDEYLGVSIEEELTPGTTSRCFRGRTADGQKAVVRVFDPHCEGAALQFPAFQRGLRALNKLQGFDEYDLSVVELICVATDQTAYVAKEYAGQSLHELVQVKMTLKVGLEAICSLARTVSAIHRHGVLVRSWKPTNVLVDGFSLVLSEPDMVHLSTLSQYRGDAGGYRAYAAPEELLGRGTRSPTADVYALGKMLEFLLTGEEPLVPLGSPPLIAQRENIPEVLVEIVKKATAQEPTDRYQQVDDLLRDLGSFQKNGERTVLMAALRPVVVSQLSIPPMSTSPELPDIDALIQERIKGREKLDEGPPPLTRARQVELALALLGGLGGLGVVLLLIVAPRSVDSMDAMGLVLAGLMGLTALFLPVPTVKRIPYRLITCFAAACLVWLVDPLALARFTWSRQLDGGSIAQKQEALKSLARVGKRDASGANFDGGHFAEVDLPNMDFTAASLENANFKKAFLVEAQFQKANVRGANFSGANLFGAKIAHAVGLEEAQCDRYTKLPEGFSCQKGFIGIQEANEPEPAAARPRESEQDGEETGARKPRTSDKVIVLPGTSK